MLEQTFECLSPEECRQYLQKLGLPEPETLTLEYLDALIDRHLRTIPFENLTPFSMKEIPELRPSLLFEKIILNQRGGYCFELNAIFLGLLRGLGYDAYPIACRARRGDELSPVRHRASIVRFHGELYYCDIGYGRILCTRAALISTDRPTITREGTFTFSEEYDGWYNIDYCPAGQAASEPMMMIGTAPAAPIDFLLPNIDMATPPSIFTESYFVQILGAHGTNSLKDHTLTLRTEKGKELREIADEDLPQVLHTVFGIEFNTR